MYKLYNKSKNFLFKNNITKESNQGIIQMRGSGSKVLVSDVGKIDINTKTTGGFRLYVAAAYVATFDWKLTLLHQSLKGLSSRY